MVLDSATSPLWASRVVELCREIRSPAGKDVRDRSRASLWELLNASISMYLRIHCSRLGSLPREDLEDIASEKSLDLLRKAESGLWDVSDRSDSDVRGFLSRVARNGLVDALREAGRRVEPVGEDRPEWDVGETAEEISMGTTESPDIGIERKEFARALRACAEKLSPRSRLAWFFRVFLDMSSRDIAAHPEINLRVTHVDVLLQRARDAVRDCMRKRGFEPRDMPAGAFVELWSAFRLEAD